MGRNLLSTTPEPQPGTVEIPNSALTCDMWAGRCDRPAHFVVHATVRIGAVDEPLSWFLCDSTSCWIRSHTHAEAIGRHVDTRPISEATAGDLAVQLAVTA